MLNSLPPPSGWYEYESLLDAGTIIDVYNGLDTRNGARVLIKIPSRSVDPDLARTFLRREFAATRVIESESILRPIEYLDRNFPALVLQGFEGGPLHACPDFRGCSIRTFIRAATAIASSLRDVHDCGLGHGALSPCHLYMREKGDLVIARITGFGLIDNNGNSTAPDLRGACLEYLAPESSGRTDAPAGPPADLYSLGVIFYEMLTGIVPFRSDDALEVLAWHLSRTPVPPHEIVGSIPRALSRLVMRLLEKDPAKRQDGAAALERELEEFRAELEGGGARRVVRNRQERDPVKFPERLFGRERERVDLYNALKRACAGDAAVSLVYGFAGIGKTALVLELGEEACRRGGRFISGKFEQYRSGEPYHAFITAFTRELVRIIGAGDDELARWRKRIKSALRSNAALIAGCLPELTAIIGDSGPAPVVDPVKGENRFICAFVKFMGLFAEKGMPLVLFLDDLQWADVPSLRMIKHMVLSGDSAYMHVIGAYRDNETGPDHPLAGVLRELDALDAPLQRVEVGPLSEEAVNEIVGAALSLDTDAVADLSRVVFRKTDGNPFFMREYLYAAVDSGFIFSGSDRSPAWDIAGMEGMPASENVVNLLVARIDTLPPTQRDLLKIASCVGCGFSLELVRRCAGLESHSFHMSLGRCVKSGFLATPADDDCTFVHDRVQESAYSLLAPVERERIHLGIGRALLEIHGVDHAESLFTIADHFNAADALVESGEERLMLRTINRRAGGKAKQSAAYGAAASYLGRAIAMAGTGAWEKDRENAFALHREYAECLYLGGRHDEAAEVVRVAMEYAASGLERAELLAILVHINTLHSKYDEVIDLGNQAFSLLGFSVPARNVDDAIQEEYHKIDTLLAARGFEFLENESLGNSAEGRTINDIARPLSLIYYFSDSKMLCLLGLKMVNFTIENGLLGLSYPWIIGFCVLDGQFYNNYRRAYELGKRVIERCREDMMSGVFGEASQRYVNIVYPWVRHLKETIELNEIGLRAALQAGDFEYAGITLVHMQLNDIHLGTRLDRCHALATERFNHAARLNHNLAMEILLAVMTATGVLMGVGTGPAGSWDGTIHAGEFGQVLTEGRNFVAIFHFHAFSFQALYFCGYHDKSLSSFAEAERYVSFMIGAFHHAELAFYRALVLCALSHERDALQGNSLIREIDTLLEKITTWSTHCPDNFLHCELLVRAELAGVNGKMGIAMSLYDQAITAARENGYLHIEALACERCGEFWRGLGKEEFARMYLRQAYERYREWGAGTKTALMEKSHSWLIKEMERKGDEDSNERILLGAFHAMLGCATSEELGNSIAGMALKYSGAERFLFLVTQEEKLLLIADASPAAVLNQIVPFEDVERHPERYPLELLRYVYRKGGVVNLDDAGAVRNLHGGEYFRSRRPRSVYCASSETDRGRVVWFFEHGSLSGIFSGVSIKVLDMLAAQGAAVVSRFFGGDNNPDGSLIVKERGRHSAIPIASILFLRSEGRNTWIHCQGKSVKATRLLRELEGALNAKNFIRIHRQFIVNLRHVVRLDRISVNKYVLVLQGRESTPLPVGRAYIAPLRKSIGI